MHDWMTEYVQAFKTLSQTRQAGMAANPILLSEILAYLTIYETNDKKAFITYILRMDASFLEVTAKKQSQKKPPERPNGK